MSKLSDIEARDAATEGTAIRHTTIWQVEMDRRYLLGLVKEARQVAKAVRHSQESDLGVYSEWVGEQMDDLLAKLDE